MVQPRYFECVQNFIVVQTRKVNYLYRIQTYMYSVLENNENFIQSKSISFYRRSRSARRKRKPQPQPNLPKLLHIRRALRRNTELLWPTLRKVVPSYCSWTQRTNMQIEEDIHANYLSRATITKFTVSYEQHNSIHLHHFS